MHSGPVLACVIAVDKSLLFSAARDGSIFASDIEIEREEDR